MARLLALLLGLALLAPQAWANDRPRRACLEVTSQTAPYVHEIRAIHDFATLEREYGKRTFVTKRNNRAFRNHFTDDAAKGLLALSVDFPIVTPLNNLFKRKPRTAAIFSLYKQLFFDNLAADPILSAAVLKHRNGTDVKYADYKNIGVLFKQDTPQIRERIKLLQEKTANDFHLMTDGIPELKALDGSRKPVFRNRRAWVTWGLGANGLQASATSRLGRYHLPRHGVPEIRDFREAEVKAELRERFDQTNLDRKAIVRIIREIERRSGKKTGMLESSEFHEDILVPSERLWDVMRKIEATDRESYLKKVAQEIWREFRVEVSENFIERMQSYYHVLDTFQPRVHERREGNIALEDAVDGAVYVDIRGQTPRNLFRMAESLAIIAEKAGLSDVQVLDQAALAVRKAQDQASRWFSKLRKQIKREARAAGLEGQISVSGDEIAIRLNPNEHESDFRKYVAAMARLGLPVRPLLVKGGTHPAGDKHITDGESIEKNLRLKLKTTRHPIEEWDNLTIAIRVVPNGPSSGEVTIYLAEKTGTGLIDRAGPLVERWLLSAEARKEFLPPGYTVNGVRNIRNGAPTGR